MARNSLLLVLLVSLVGLSWMPLAVMALGIGDAPGFHQRDHLEAALAFGLGIDRTALLGPS